MHVSHICAKFRAMDAKTQKSELTRAAIVGPGRVDLFVGSGEEARVAAAHTSYPGELFLLLPRRSRR